MKEFIPPKGLPKDCCVYCDNRSYCDRVCPKVKSEIIKCDEKGEYCRDYHAK